MTMPDISLITAKVRIIPAFIFYIALVELIILFTGTDFASLLFGNQVE